MDVLLSTWVPIVEGIVTILALIAGTVIAWIGLSTWRDQLVSRTDYDLARRMMIECYRVRSAIRSARPFGPPDLYAGEGSQWKWHDKGMAEAGQEVEKLKVDLLEAQVLWDEKTIIAFSGLLLVWSQLESASRVWRGDKESNPEAHEKYRDVLFRQDIHQMDDKFDKLVDRQIERIQDRLRPKLTLNRRRSSRAVEQELARIQAETTRILSGSKPPKEGKG